MSELWVDPMEYEHAVEFGGLLGSVWGGLSKVVGVIYANKGLLDVGCAALEGEVPGAGKALKSGIQLVDAAASGNQAALAQIASITAAAKAGDAAKSAAHDMLKVISDARKVAVVGAYRRAVQQAMVGKHHHHGGGRGFPGGIMWGGYPDPWFMAEEIEYGYPDATQVLDESTVKAVAKEVAAQLKTK